MSAPPDPDAFIARWEHASGSELANYQLFVTELCGLLGVELPEPSQDDPSLNRYVFERRVTFAHGDGSTSTGRIDCYRRGAFVLEAKKVRASSDGRYDDALLRARSQAENYARALPADEGRPPFVLVVDVGRSIEVYAEFTRTGATYVPYPDPRSHRFALRDLANPVVRERLRAIWTDPLALDPARLSARVTRDIAQKLARVAQSLEAQGHPAERVAGFLTRCLFSMFAEDVGLLPGRSFATLLESLKDNPQQFVPLLAELWRAMDAGGFSVSVRADLPRFNGKLFRNPNVLPLTAEQIDLLLEAARADWREVEPAIFGTLLERALDPDERHALGAHFTPRAYVERLVMPTVVEPLREDWKAAQTAALLLAAEGRMDDARQAVRAFLQTLCQVRVLDPACGSGNFLYVTLEHLKRLEGEVLNQLEALGDTQGRLEAEGITVDPHQLLGIEINPRAAAIAETVLWIGYLQWHYRTRGQVLPPQPVLKDFHNIECRDAILAYDRMEYETDARGVPVTCWDGRTTKRHPTTGEQVPDESARMPIERYVNVRAADWPQAEFIVGNPPFIGNKRMRDELGDGYVEAVRKAVPAVPDSADFVMYWWHKAAVLTAGGDARRFGLITTNSITMAFNRRIVEAALAANPPVSLVFAVNDHPWVDASDGAAVRIAMTVGVAGAAPGTLLRVVDESEGADGVVEVRVETRRGAVHADLTIGADLAAARPLRANELVANRGVIPHGAGFVVTPDDARGLGLGTDSGLERRIRPYRNGKDLADRPRNALVIDLHGMAIEEVRSRYPGVFQWIVERVKPERDQNRVKAYRDKWWLFVRSRGDFRTSVVDLRRYIATGHVAKHRVFQFLDADILPDDKLIAIALDDASMLAVLSSRVHVAWALATGGRLGVGNDPVYSKSTSFDRYPFPEPDEPLRERLRALGEELDAHRKARQSAHADLTITGMYNVLEKLRAGEALDAKERRIHEDGLVSVLRSLHDEIDLATLDAYGWGDLAPLILVINGNAAAGTGGTPDTRDGCFRALDDALLTRLVALNGVRMAEESTGQVRWLRPGFQRPQDTPAPAPRQELLPVDVEPEAAEAVAAASRRPWPRDLADQIRAVAEVLAESPGVQTVESLGGRFTGRGPWKRRLPVLLDSLVAVGRARATEGGFVRVS